MINFKFLGKTLLLLSLLYQTPLQAHGPSDTSLKLSIEKIINQGGKKTVVFKLTDSKTNQAIQLKDLAEVHTQKMHLLVIDDSLSDYAHVHPDEAYEPGVYTFSWLPTKKDANYRLWADLVPLNTHKQVYVIADLYKSKSEVAKIIPEQTMTAVVGGYTFKLSFDKAQLQKGKAAMGRIEVSDSRGKPVTELEPLMGAYAHLVGFNEDFNSVVHIHPMGAEPQKNSDRGGPELSFHIEPQKTGFIKLFAQVKIKGKEYFAPFGLVVQ